MQDRQAIPPHFDKLRSVQTCRRSCIDNPCMDNRNDANIIGPTLEPWWRGPGSSDFRSIREMPDIIPVSILSSPLYPGRGTRG